MAVVYMGDGDDGGDVVVVMVSIHTCTLNLGPCFGSWVHCPLHLTWSPVLSDGMVPAITGCDDVATPSELYIYA